MSVRTQVRHGKRDRSATFSTRFRQTHNARFSTGARGRFSLCRIFPIQHVQQSVFSKGVSKAETPHMLVVCASASAVREPLVQFDASELRRLGFPSDFRPSFGADPHSLQASSTHSARTAKREFDDELDRLLERHAQSARASNSTAAFSDTLRRQQLGKSRSRPNPRDRVAPLALHLKPNAVRSADPALHPAIRHASAPSKSTILWHSPHELAVVRSNTQHPQEIEPGLLEQEERA